MRPKTVHVLFKTHLDLGFTEMAEQVCASYVEDFIPRALELAQQTRVRGSQRFVWTTGAWLIDHFLAVASPDRVRQMERAIEAGDILWHALAFTTHTELMPPELFVHGLSICSKLDRAFGKHTVAGKMTDVPGHTRSMIPYLVDRGITYLHIGVNAASSTAQIPSRFRWRHPGGEEILVSYGSGYDAAADDPDADDLLHFAHTGDNQGPPSADAVDAEFATLEAEHPDDTVMTSSLDAYARTLAARRESLPIVESELGDTWIHGVGSDPLKVAGYRCINRCLANLDAASDAGPAERARDQLLLVAEHTWGKDEKSHLKDYVNYTPASFQHARRQDLVETPRQDEFGAHRCQFRYSEFEASWEEQRQYVEKAALILRDTPVHAELGRQLDALRPRRRVAQFESTASGPGPQRLGGFHVELCEQTGALTSCVDRHHHEWAANGRLGLFRYQTFDAQSFDTFYDRYNPNRRETESWARSDFTKPGLEHVDGLRRADVLPTSARWAMADDTVLAELTLPEVDPTGYGVPDCIQIHYRFHDDHIDIELQWFSKPACRLPEASWLGFGLPHDGDWVMEKMGSAVSPFDVAAGGNRSLHALDSGRIFQRRDPHLCLQSVDAPLFCPGRPRILEFDTNQPVLTEGWHVNLHNNLWGTNFPMWFADDMKFRFRLGPADQTPGTTG